MFKRKLIALLLVLAMIFTGYGFNTLTVSAASKKQEVSISQTKLSLLKGKSETLTIQISPTSQAKKASISWKSSNERVATVNAKGTVKAKKKGSATVTATIKLYGKTYKKECKVTVTNPVTKITLNSTCETLNINDTFQIKVKVTPHNATNKKVTYQSSDSSIASVSSTGVVRANKIGKAVVTVTSKDGSGIYAEVKVVVEEKNLEIGSSNILVRNETYDNVTIGNSINNATVNLEGVTIRGTLTLTDGASYKVVVKDCNIKNILVSSAVTAKADTTVLLKHPTIEMLGKTRVEDIEFNGNGTLSGTTTGTVGTVHVTRSATVWLNTGINRLLVDAEASSSRIIIDSIVKLFEINADNTGIELGLKSIIESLISNGKSTSVTGEGKVTQATINGADTKLNTKVEVVTTGPDATGTTVNGSNIPVGTTTKPGDTPGTGGGGGGGTGGGTGGGNTSTTVTINGSKVGDTITYTLPVSYTSLSQVVVTYKGTSYTVDGAAIKLLQGFLSNETTSIYGWNVTTAYEGPISGQTVKVTGPVGNTKKVSFVGGKLDGNEYSVTVNPDGSVTVNGMYTLSKDGTTTLKISGSLSEVPTFTVTY